ncbi:urease accessory protein [Streptoalloteichus tenebrarius]|uniref:Urease accessory protein UreD n=1 Tax=Streptoalloteichus tenebrarius (strain ATCC 17920 / DSM 40477 / JCM 4838 / CBS 697.72 / NBRC 16177 / NCIMB 11028 / NRRL B-12390 / A12253. 1 / ISP 5477) TaxID=1933 RepID=A0ABT1HVK6_STRSD|nr:urease accessory protein UreD [Streptoalloteichus tenebrarius]MCP2259554.1 urease accessory protein [Streptoalloteichus tenebrarius]BFF01363.1 urease accessory protein UreD [Streptoalloteichus tenebrarius]
MRARARLVVARDDAGRTVVRELRSMTPLTLVPRRPRVRARDGDDAATVHLVSSATAPLGGDELDLTVVVGPGAGLRLHGVAATLALPGHHPGGSGADVRIEVAEGGWLEYLPEPTVVTARADHTATLRVDLASDARFRSREVLVLGRSGERAGRLRSTVHLTRAGEPLLRQRVDVGEAWLDASAAHLAGRRVLATELLVWGPDPAEPASGDWWSLVPLARGGSMATALAADAVTAHHALATAVAAHPGLRETIPRHSNG